MVYWFGSYKEAMHWDACILHIKGRIREINGGNPTPQQYEDWLAEAHTFHRRFGSAFVPPDVRDAINSVERGTFKIITHWT